MYKTSTKTHFKDRSLCSWTPDSEYSQNSSTVFHNSSFYIERQKKKLEDLKLKRNRNILSQSTKTAAKPPLRLPIISPEVSISSSFSTKSFPKLVKQYSISPAKPLREYENPFKCSSILHRRITFKCLKPVH